MPRNLPSGGVLPTGLAFPVGVALVLGASLPLGLGLLLPVILWAAGAMAAGLLLTRLRAATPTGGLAVRLAALSDRERWLMAPVLAVSSAVFVAASLRGIGSLAVSHPASIWVALPLVCAGLVGAFVRASGLRTGLFAALALSVPAAALGGAAQEASAPDAHGAAHSGPILGIHPFQTTAVTVDGYGPFDIPINDYVEPDGSRGYGPGDLADALQRALRRIGSVHYADGPARAHKAFSEAKVEAVTTTAVQETLDRDPAMPTQARFVATSGTWGQGSRVQFVCPGQRNDPRPRPDDAVGSRMCPDKYASEASAGLGVTGRWPGYSEVRGAVRTGLGPLFGWTRSDDESGRRVAERERRLWGWGVLLVVLGLSFRPRAAAGIQSTAGGVAIVAVLGMLVGTLLHMPAIRIGPVDLPAGMPRFEGVAALTPALVGFLGLGAWVGTRDPRAATLVRLRHLPVLLGTLLVAGHLGAAAWNAPTRVPGPGEDVFGGFVRGLADRISVSTGADVQFVESLVAGVLVALLVGAVVDLLTGATAGHLRVCLTGVGEGDDPRGRLPAFLLVAIPAAALVVSRKTGGGTALVPGAVAMAALWASSLNLGAFGRRPAALVIHVVAVIGVLACSVELVAGPGGGSAGQPAGFVLFYAALGAVAALLAGSLVLPGSTARPTTGSPSEDRATPAKSPVEPPQADGYHPGPPQADEGADDPSGSPKPSESSESPRS